MARRYTECHCYFLIGCAHNDEMAFSDEKPHHQVNLPAFRVSHYPIANAQFAAFV